MATHGKSERNRNWAGQPRGRALLLETSGDWIKMLEVSGRARRGVTVTRAHLEPVSRETVVADSIKHAVKNGGFTPMPVQSCIPRQLVNVRLLELPSTEPAEVADMVNLQISRQTPYSLNEILSASKTLGMTRQSTYTRVMLAIVRRSIVRERFYDIEAAGLSTERMTISSEGVLNWFLYRTRHDAPETVTALLDVDSFFTHMMVVQHYKVIYTKSILWGAGQAKDGLDAFVQRVREAVQACEETLRGERIQRVMISGAGIRLDGVEAAMGEALAVPCEKADCLDDVTLARDALSLRERGDTASLTALVGMALAPNLLDLDFVPDVVRLREQIGIQSRRWSTAAAILLAAMLCASLLGMLAAGYRFQRLRTVRRDTEALQDRVVRVERMLEVIRATRDRLDARFLPEHLLPVVHAAIPDGVYLDSLDLDSQTRRITMGGTAPSRGEIRELIRRLEESPYFQAVEEGGRTAMNREERFTFQVVGRFEEEVAIP